MSATTEVVARRPGFKLPAPLNTNEESSDRGVWSPNRRNASIVASGEFRSNSPRASQVSSLLGLSGHGSGSSSPKAPTPAKFEDPLLTMPSFRRAATGGSPTVEPSAFASPLSPSPSFRAGLSSSNSFSARRASTGLDFRRSVPGAAHGSAGGATSSASGSGVGESASHRNTREHNLLRGTSEYGSMEFGGPQAYESSVAGSESGVLGPEDDDSTDVLDVDSAVHMAVARRHSTINTTSSGGGSAAAAAATSSPGGGSPLPGGNPARLALRSTIAFTNGSLGLGHSLGGGGDGGGREDDEDFQTRLQQNRQSWRARGNSVGAAAFVSLGGGGGGGAGEGLQNKTHAALQQLRGELKSLSMRSMNAAAAVAGGGGGAGGSGGAAAVAPHCHPSGQASPVADSHTSGPRPASGPSSWTASPQPAGVGGGVGSSSGATGPQHGKMVEGAGPLQLPSPSRLSVSRSAAAATSSERMGGSPDSRIPQQPSPLRLVQA